MNSTKPNNPLSTGMMPHLEPRHLSVASSYVWNPRKWINIRQGKYRQLVEQSFTKRLHVPTYALDSGRSALYVALKAAGVKEGDEVIIQAFTCVVVINAITACGATPVYVDITDDFVTTAEHVEAAITDKTAVIIIQHTFGKLADTKSICKVAKNHNIPTITDAAHALGASYVSGEPVGTVADMTIFSFGSEKTISAVRGGLLVVGNDSYLSTIKTEIERLAPYTWIQTMRHLKSMLLFDLIKKPYITGSAITQKLLRITLRVLRAIRASFSILEPQEKQGSQPGILPRLMPNALAHILFEQLATQDEVYAKRQQIAAAYATKLHQPGVVSFSNNEVPMMYPVRSTEPTRLFAHAKQHHILLGTSWNDVIVVPPSVAQSHMMYQSGSCPNAEKIIKNLLLLPLSQTMTNADTANVIAVMNGYDS